MILSTTSSLNHFHPLSCSSSKSLPSKTTHMPWPQKERSWKRQCVIGLACIILGLEMGNSIIDQDIALAWGMQQGRLESKSKVPRWSDKRACLPWRLNSLETIVPENLPRPSFRRRWETVHYSGKTEEAAARVLPKLADYTKRCFSL